MCAIDALSASANRNMSVDGPDEARGATKTTNGTYPSRCCSLYVIQLPKSFVVWSTLVSVACSFAVGRYVRTLFTLWVVEELMASQGAIKPGELSLPSSYTHKPVPATLYTSKNFDTGLTATSDSVFVQRATPLPTVSSCVVQDNGSHVCDPKDLTVQVPLQHSILPPTDAETQHQPSGQHLLVDIEHVDASFLNSEQRLAQAMIDLISDSDLTLLSYHCHRLQPVGVSCVGVLLESHVSFHTWPLEGVITLDLFTCGPQSLLPLLPKFQALFGVPHTQPEKEGQPHMVWSHKRRGFRYGENKSPEEIDMYVWLLGNMKSEKSAVASVETDFQTIHIWDVVDPRFRTHDSYLKSLSNDGSYESQNPELFEPDRVVYLDNIMQSRRFGDHAYHEALVHPTLFTHPNPKRVAIIGGGEGATLREVLKHKTVEKVVMIEIDEEMLSTSRKHLPEWSDCSNIVGSSSSCFDDPRTEVHTEDAVAWFIENFHSSEKVDPASRFDVIIMDALDPGSVIEFSDYLYNNINLMDSFYNGLTEAGLFTIQIGESDHVSDAPVTHRRNDQLQSLLLNFQEAGFESLFSYDEAHGRFLAPWDFLVAMKSRKSRDRWFASEADFNFAIRSRALPTQNGHSPFHYFDGAMMLSYQYPSRISEEMWCREGTHGICGKLELNPEIPHIMTAASSETNALSSTSDRVALAKDQAFVRTYFGLDTSGHAMHVLSSSLDLVSRVVKKFGGTHWNRLSNALIKSQADEKSHGSPAFNRLAFSSHGCQDWYNIGAVADDALSAKSGASDSLDDVHNPYQDRHSHWQSLGNCVRVTPDESGKNNFISIDEVGAMTTGIIR